MTELTLAIDIGGTKIAVGLVDPAGTLTHSARLPTPAGSDAEAVWGVVDGLAQEALGVAGGTVRAAGIASAGPVDLRAGTVSPLNIPAWRGFPLRDRVAAALPSIPVRLGGDGLCMALGERWRGAGHGADFLLGMVVSTGVGGGLVLDGAPYDGRTGNAGHVGHVVVDLDGDPCSCGGHGCVETIASGPHMVTWAQANGWPGGAGGPPDARQLAADADAGHPVAREAFRRGATAVAAMIASVAATCDLDLVVVGGGVSRSGPTLFAPLRHALTRHTGLSYLHDLRVLPATLPDAGLIGAAALAQHPM